MKCQINYSFASTYYTYTLDKIYERVNNLMNESSICSVEAEYKTNNI